MVYPDMSEDSAMRSQHDPPVRFAFSPEFSRNLYGCLSAIEFRALKFILESEPEVGVKVRGSRNTRGLDYCGCVIYYSYESFFNAIYIFEIKRTDWFGKLPRTWIQRLRNFFR